MPVSDKHSARSRFGALVAACVLAAAGRGQEPAADLDRVPGESDGTLAPELAEALRGRDVVQPFWEGEAAVADWTQRLKQLLDGTLPARTDAGEPVHVRFVDRRPAEWTPVFSNGGLVVQERVHGAGTTEGQALLELDLEALRARLERYADGTERRVALKTVAVELDATGAWTEVHAATFESGPRGRLQHQATWRVRWPREPRAADASGEGPPLEFVWEAEQRATLDSAEAPFVDCTLSAFRTPLPEACVLGLDTWRRRLDSLLGSGLLGHQGLAVGDVNGDGWEDLYVCQPGGLPNRLFLSEKAPAGHGTGALVDASAGSGADYLDRTASALLLDLDQDAELDLVLATATEILLLAGDGSGRFELRGRLAASTTTSLAASDFDLDGDLDLYACGYVSPYDDSATPVPYHDANNGERNQLLRNDGDFEFVDATTEVGLDTNNRRFSFAASWADFDRDGDPDLYVANDFGRNNLYRNDDGRFADVAAELGVEDIAAGMGVAWGDVDNDGWEDLYVSNMYSSAGSRVAYEPAFQAGAGAEERGALRRHARGNTLFHNRAGVAFEDVTASAGVAMGRWAWGSILFDMNDDGWLDALVPNGMITGERSDDL